MDKFAEIIKKQTYPRNGGIGMGIDTIGIVHVSTEIMAMIKKVGEEYIKELEEGKMGDDKGLISQIISYQVEGVTEFLKRLEGM